MAAAATVAALSGYGHYARDVRELLHLLHCAGHQIKEAVEDFLEDDDAAEGKRR